MKPLYRITAPHFCAGFVEGEFYAPIIRYMESWRLSRIENYCQYKGWQIERLGMSKPSAVIYCDGASTKDWRGGWGATLKYDGWWYDMHGGEYDTTNNRMELTAAIEALNWLPVSCRVTIYCDSQYVIKGMTDYLETWKFCGWRTSSNKPVKNVDLWKELERVAARHEVDWRWVRGHAGVVGNEQADRLAARGVPPKRENVGSDHGDETRQGTGVARRLQRTVQRQV